MEQIELVLRASKYSTFPSGGRYSQGLYFCITIVWHLDVHRNTHSTAY